MTINAYLNHLYSKSMESLQNSNFDRALDYLQQINLMQPENFEILRLLGIVNAQKGYFKEALRFLNLALRLQPKNPLALSNLGNVYLSLKMYKESLEAYDHSIKIQPDYFEAWSNKGNALQEMGRYEEAIKCFDQSINLKPNFGEAWSNKGNALQEMGRYEEAIKCFDQSINLKPNFGEAWSNKGYCLAKVGDLQEAILCYEKAIELNPMYPRVWLNRGNVLQKQNLHKLAIANFDQAIKLQPVFLEAWINKAESCRLIGRHQESSDCFLKSLELSKEDEYLLGRAHHQMMYCGNWSDYELITNKIFQGVSESRKVAEPFGFLGISKSEELTKKCAEIYSADKYPVKPNNISFTMDRREKIRLGYLCGEFREHANAILMARIWELHDQSRFELYAFDNGWDDGSEYRKRIENSFFKIIDVSKISDNSAAEIIRSLEIDILINLNGYFGLARPGIFLHKPAPVQVNYLGFPGTLGSTAVDYLIADNIVIPEAARQSFFEKIVYLPNSYQPNDNLRKISGKKFTKTEFGLPEQGFIFCCFNSNYKITPETFESWTNILRNTPGSVLWLLSENLSFNENITKEASKRGIAPGRIIFTKRMELSEHLARHQLADLFLDTLPYNAHTTASDALWAGIPVLTLLGNTFPGRVAASLLSAVGMPELITKDRHEYESLAIELANHPIKMAELKLKLNANRNHFPLFNSSLYVRNLEKAYEEMVRKYRSGLNAEHFYVGPIVAEK